jgi:hypothetical protein
MKTAYWSTSMVSTIKIIESVHCYEVKTIIHGIADTRRPNNKKPLYVRKTIKIPTAYMMSGNILICHPQFRKNLEKRMAESMKKSIDSMVRLLGESDV